MEKNLNAKEIIENLLADGTISFEKFASRVKIILEEYVSKNEINATYDELIRAYVEKLRRYYKEEEKKRRVKKPTLATLKSFIKKNINNIEIFEGCSFSGMTDGLEYTNRTSNVIPEKFDTSKSSTWGLPLIYICGSGRDTVTKIENGFSIYNCCGSWEITLKDN